MSEKYILYKKVNKGKAIGFLICSGKEQLEKELAKGKYGSRKHYNEKESDREIEAFNKKRFVK